MLLFKYVFYDSFDWKKWNIWNKWKENPSETLCCWSGQEAWLDQCEAAERGSAFIGVALPIIGNCSLIPNVSPQIILYCFFPLTFDWDWTLDGGEEAKTSKGIDVRSSPKLLKNQTKKRKPCWGVSEEEDCVNVRGLFPSITFLCLPNLRVVPCLPITKHDELPVKCDKPVVNNVCSVSAVLITPS